MQRKKIVLKLKSNKRISGQITKAKVSNKKKSLLLIRDFLMYRQKEIAVKTKEHKNFFDVDNKCFFGINAKEKSTKEN